MDEVREAVESDDKGGSKIELALILKGQAEKLLSMTELWAEVERAVVISDAKADASVGEEHQRHVGAKIAYKEFIARVKRLAAYEVSEKKKGGNNYA